RGRAVRCQGTRPRRGLDVTAATQPFREIEGEKVRLIRPDRRKGTAGRDTGHESPYRLRADQKALFAAFIERSESPVLDWLIPALGVVVVGVDIIGAAVPPMSIP